MFLAGGIEGSNITLTYVLYELAKNPEVQNTVFEELKAVAGLPLNPDKIHALKYTDQVINGKFTIQI